jgi:hypothetical protein
MPDRTLGQVAYEKHVQVFGDSGRKPAWIALRPPVRERWETIAAAVLAESDAAKGAFDMAPAMSSGLPPRTCTCGLVPHEYDCPALDDR